MEMCIGILKLHGYQLAAMARSPPSQCIYSILGFYRDDGKEHGNYCSKLCYIGIMEKKKENEYTARANTVVQQTL